MPQIADLDNQLALMEREFELKVSEGYVERDADGRINAHVSFSGVTKNNTAGMKLLGIDKQTFSTKEKFLSVDQDNPTVFEATANFSIEKGAMMAPLLGDVIPIDTDVDGDMFTTVRMYKEGDTAMGKYVTFTVYRIDLPGMGVMQMELDLTGRFSLRLID